MNVSVYRGHHVEGSLTHKHAALPNSLFRCEEFGPEDAVCRNQDIREDGAAKIPQEKALDEKGLG
jgi:hypothetical protein